MELVVGVRRSVVRGPAVELSDQRGEHAVPLVRREEPPNHELSRRRPWWMRYANSPEGATARSIHDSGSLAATSASAHTPPWVAITLARIRSERNGKDVWRRSESSTASFRIQGRSDCRDASRATTRQLGFARVHVSSARFASGPDVSFQPCAQNMKMKRGTGMKIRRSLVLLVVVFSFTPCSLDQSRKRMGTLPWQELSAMGSADECTRCESSNRA